MCLTQIFLDTKSSENIFMEDVSHISCDGDSIEVHTMFGERKMLQGYRFSEASLLEHYVILVKNGNKNE